MIFTKQDWILIKQAYQLAIVVVAVVILSIVFYGLCRMLEPRPREAIEDEEQLYEMKSYQHKQGRTNLLFFNN